MPSQLPPVNVTDGTVTVRTIGTLDVSGTGATLTNPGPGVASLEINSGSWEISGTPDTVSNVTSVVVTGGALNELSPGVAELYYAEGTLAEVSNNGTQIATNVYSIDFTSNLTVTDIGGGIVEVAASGGGGSLEINQGTLTVAAVDTLVIGSGVTLASGAANSATLTAAGGGGGGIGTIIAAGATATADFALASSPAIVKPTFTSWFNQGSDTYTDNTNGPGSYERTANANANNIRMRYKSLAAGAFTLVACLNSIIPNGGNGPNSIIGLTDGTKLAAFYYATGATTNYVGAKLWTNSTTSGSTLITFRNFTPAPNPIWVKITYDGSSVIEYFIGMDGPNGAWISLGTTTIAALTFTPTGIGFGMDEYNGVATAAPYATSLNYWAGA